MLRSFVGAAGCLAILAVFPIAATHSAAANRDVFQVNRIALPCWIENEKVIAVVNSTGSTFAAGGTLRVDAVTMPAGQHYIRSWKIGKTPSGTIIQKGAVRSSSCTASVTTLPPVVRGE